MGEKQIRDFLEKMGTKGEVSPYDLFLPNLSEMYSQG